MSSDARCPLCTVGTPARKLVEVVLNPGTLQEFVVRISEDLYNRIKATVAESKEKDHEPR